MKKCEFGVHYTKEDIKEEIIKEFQKLYERFLEEDIDDKGWTRIFIEDIRKMNNLEKINTEIFK